MSLRALSGVAGFHHNRWPVWVIWGGQFGSEYAEYTLQTGNGTERYTSILRYFGWAVVFGVTRDKNVVTLVQWKPGVNCASWEPPPGGIGKIGPEATTEEIIKKSSDAFLRETGYIGKDWRYIGKVFIETGKYRGTGPADHGLPAHMILASDLIEHQSARKPNANEIIETLLVPLDQFPDVIESGLFVETSALTCSFLALLEIGKLRWTPKVEPILKSEISPERRRYKEIDKQAATDAANVITAYPVRNKYKK